MCNLTFILLLTINFNFKIIGTNVFSMAIHHGGRFYSHGGLEKEYRGGEMVYVDGVILEKLSFTGFNYFAFNEKPRQIFLSSL